MPDYDGFGGSPFGPVVYDDIIRDFFGRPISPVNDPLDIHGMLKHGDPSVRRRREQEAAKKKEADKLEGARCDEERPIECDEPFRGTRSWGPGYLVDAFFAQDQEWITAAGEHKLITEMDGGHLVNTILMLERVQDDIVPHLAKDLQNTKLYRAMKAELNGRLVPSASPAEDDAMANFKVYGYRETDANSDSSKQCIKEMALSALGRISVDLARPGGEPTKVKHAPDYDYFVLRGGRCIGYGEFAQMFADALDTEIAELSAYPDRVQSPTVDEAVCFDFPEGRSEQSGDYFIPHKWTGALKEWSDRAIHDHFTSMEIAATEKIRQLLVQTVDAFICEYEDEMQLDDPIYIEDRDAAIKRILATYPQVEDGGE